MPQLANASETDSPDSLTLLAAACSVALLAAVACVAAVRSGFSDGIEVKAATVVFCLVAIWLPVVAMRRSPAGEARNVLLAAAAAAGLLLPASGLLLGGHAIWLAIAILVLCVAGVLPDLARVACSRIAFAAMAGGLGLGVALFFSDSAARYQMPEALELGIAHSDNYFHAAIARMILQFGVPSIGADGLIFQKYHTGSHFVLAGFARASDAPVPLSYVYWGGVGLKIQLLWSLLLCAVLLARKAGRSLPALACAAYVLLYLWIGAGFLKSESFMLALALFFAGVPLAASLVAAKDAATAASRGSLAVLVALMFLCAAAKVSVGFFCGIILAWLAWRGRRDWPNVTAILLSFILLLMVSLKFLIPRELSLLDSGLGSVINSYLQYLGFPTIVSYLVPAIIVVWVLARINLAPDAALGRDAWSAQLRLEMQPVSGPRQAYLRFIDSDGYVQILGLCLLACVGVLFTVPVGSNMAYFSGVVLFMCACAVPGWFVRGSGLAQRWFQRHALWSVLVVLLPLLVLAAGFLKDFATSSVALIRALPAASADGERPESPARSSQLLVEHFSTSLRQTGTLFGTLQVPMAAAPWATVMRDVEKHRTLHGVLAVYVRPSTFAFWQRLKDGSPYWCVAAHLMIPAQVGVPMIRGITSQNYERQCMPDGQVWYGFGRRQDEHRTVDMTDPELCTQARLRGFGGVYVLDSIAAPQANRVLACTAG